MSTKKVEYYIDLYPGWQDHGASPCVMCEPCGVPPFLGKRIRVIVELPCIGGKAAITDTRFALSREVECGFKPAEKDAAK